MTDRNKALFLDRDGVINEERDYIYRKEEFVFLPGVFEICLHFQNQGFKIFVITNQSGIGRGYYTEGDFLRLNNWMLSQFSLNKINIDKVYFCPFHPEHGIGKYKKDSEDRKPKPGMIIKAKEEYDLILSECVLIGDKESDIQCGINAGVGTNILINSNNEKADVKADYKVEKLLEIKDLILI